MGWSSRLALLVVALTCFLVASLEERGNEVARLEEDASHSSLDNKRWANDQSLDLSWMDTADRRGQHEAKLAMAQGKRDSLARAENLQRIEEGYDAAASTNAGIKVKEAEEALQAARYASKKAQKKATLNSLNVDKVEKRSVRIMATVDSDADAPDKHDFLTPARSEEDDKAKISANEQLEDARAQETEQDQIANQMARKVDLAKEELTNARQNKEVADGLLVQSKMDTTTAAYRTAGAKKQAAMLEEKERLQQARKTRKASNAKRLAKLQPFHEDNGNLVMIKDGDENKLVRVRYPASSDGMRTVYTVINRKLRALRIPAKEELLSQDDQSLAAKVPDRRARKQERRTSRNQRGITTQAEKEHAEVLRVQKRLDDKDKLASLIGNKGKGLPKFDGFDSAGQHSGVELGQGSPMEMLNPQQATAAIHAAHRLEVIPPTRTEKMLNDVDAMAASLSDDVTRATESANWFNSEHQQRGVRISDDVNQDLKEGVAKALKAVNATPNTSPLCNQTIGQDAIIEELRAKLAAQEQVIAAQKLQIDSMSNNNGHAKSAQDIADAWATQHLGAMNTEVKKFSNKLLSLKKDAKRKRIAQISTSAWLSSVKMVDDSADDVRMAKVAADRAVSKFKDSRIKAEDAKVRVKKNKKTALYAKQEFEGFGPKMSDERANASAQARQIAKARIDAKKKMLETEARYKKSINWRVETLRVQKHSSGVMMKKLLKYIETLKELSTNQNAAAGFRRKAEIARRTSCQVVQGQVSFARKKCKCDRMTGWANQLEKDKNRIAVTSLGAKLKSCKRNVELCKIGWRKQGLVYAVPLGKGDLGNYSKTGLVPNVTYSNASALNATQMAKLKKQESATDTTSLELYLD